MIPEIERLTALEARVTQLLESHDWIFAKTMPQNPHWYTLRRDWGNDEDFDMTVQFIRENGYTERWPDPVRGSPYTVLDLNGFHYWTMGAPIPDTILINRKPLVLA